MLAVHLVTVCLCAAERLLRLVRRKVTMLHAFTILYHTFTSRGSGLIDTLAQLLAWRSLLWLFMTWRRSYLTQSNFLSTTSLTWSLALYLLFCFSQEKTHTHIHMSAISLRTFIFEKKNFQNCFKQVQLGRQT